MDRRDQAQGAEGSGALRSIGDSCAALGKQVGECGHSFWLDQEVLIEVVIGYQCGEPYW